MPIVVNLTLTFNLNRNLEQLILKLTLILTQLYPHNYHISELAHHIKWCLYFTRTFKCFYKASNKANLHAWMRPLSKYNCTLYFINHQLQFSIFVLNKA
jgi:hypothetical protein